VGGWSVGGLGGAVLGGGGVAYLCYTQVRKLAGGDEKAFAQLVLAKKFAPPRERRIGALARLWPAPGLSFSPAQR
jgi:hypothetical protein